MEGGCHDPVEGQRVQREKLQRAEGAERMAGDLGIQCQHLSMRPVNNTRW